MGKYRWGTEDEDVEEERKLVHRPRCVVELRVEVRWFEEERGVPVVKVLVPNKLDELALMLLVSRAEMTLKVEVDPEVREDHVILVGEAREDA